MAEFVSKYNLVSASLRIRVPTDVPEDVVTDEKLEAIDDFLSGLTDPILTWITERYPELRAEVELRT